MSVRRAPSRKESAAKGSAKRSSSPRPKPARSSATPKAPVLIRATVDIRAPRGRVWTALTSPDEVNRWFTARCEFEARPGGRVLYYWNPSPAQCPPYVTPSSFGTAAEARVETWDPPRALVLRALSHWPGEVAFRLEATPTGTHVVVEHTGWPSTDAWYTSHAEGWAEALDLLRRYLELTETEFDAYRAKKEARSRAA